MPSSGQKKILLQRSNKQTFEVEERVAIQLQTIKHMIEDECTDNDIPVANVTSSILAKVIEYCKHHVEADAKDDANAAYSVLDKGSDDELKKFDKGV